MNKKYLILYYICSIITFVLLPFAYFLYVDGCQFHELIDYSIVPYNLYILIFTIINIILFIIITVLLILKKKININSLTFPISYIVFYIFILIIVILFNHYTYTQNIHLMYYYSFVMFDYMLFNIYTILCFDYKKRSILKILKK